MDKNFHPTDELEQNRMDIHHEIMLELLSGELYKAPLKAPRTILDIGTGTGIWAIDMCVCRHHPPLSPSIHPPSISHQTKARVNKIQGG